MALRHQNRETAGPDADLAELRETPFWLTASVSSEGDVYYAVYTGEPVLDPDRRAWAPGRNCCRLMLFLNDDILPLQVMCERGAVEVPEPGCATPVTIAFFHWADSPV